MAERKHLGVAGLGLAIIAALLLIAVPYYRSVRAEYNVFARYMQDTVKDPVEPPAWERGVLQPPACVTATIDWGLACPGVLEFCKGALPEVTRACLASQPRSTWCSAQDKAWMTTGFGYHDCQDRLTGLEESDAKIVEKYCAIGWRAVAAHCREGRD